MMCGASRTGAGGAFLPPKRRNAKAAKRDKKDTGFSPGGVRESLFAQGGNHVRSGAGFAAGAAGNARTKPDLGKNA